MSYRIKRLRVFAGPNGSGKTTLFEYLVKIHAFHLYFHINPDIIAKDLFQSCNMNNFPFHFTEEELRDFLDHSPYQPLVPFRLADSINICDYFISLKNKQSIDITYLAATLAEWIRYKMFEFGSSFSFETVCSHPSKIEEIENAKKAKYKIYLYFISATEPSINMERVGLRVERGGHAVPGDKIRTRYFRTMENLYGIFSLADRAFFFDNSTSNASGTLESELFTLFAEKRDNTLYIPGGAVPAWFNTYLLEKLA